MKTRSIFLTLAITALTVVACGKKADEAPATDTTKKDTVPAMPAPTPPPAPPAADTMKHDSTMKHDDHGDANHDHKDDEKGAAGKTTAKPAENKSTESETRRAGQNTAKESEVRRGGSTNSSQESNVRRTPSGSSNSSSQESSVRRNP